MSKERNIETFTADWNGIGIQIDNPGGQGATVYLDTVTTK